MDFLKKVFARTIHFTMAEQNRMVYRFRCGNTRQNARKNPDYFDDKALKCVASVIAFIKYWIVVVLKKMIYIGTIAFIPYEVMGLITGYQVYAYESAMAYIFIVMSVLFGSLINPWLYRLNVNEKKYLVILDERYYFMDRLVTKMVSDAIGFALALRIFQVGFWQYGLWISIAAALLRPFGEVLAYLIRHKTVLGKRGHNSFVGICMALAFIAAYVLPIVDKSIDKGNSFFYGIGFAFICILVFSVSIGLFVTIIDFKKVAKAVLKED